MVCVDQRGSAPLVEEAVDELVVEPPRVAGGLGGTSELPEAHRRGPRGQCAIQVMVDRLLARPRAPLAPDVRPR